MRGSVLAIAHGVMGEDEDGWKLHQGGEADRRPSIIAEDEEGRPKGAQLRVRQPVEDRGHGVLANAKMEISAPRWCSLEMPGTGKFQECLCGWCYVRRAAPQPGEWL